MVISTRLRCGVLALGTAMLAAVPAAGAATITYSRADGGTVIYAAKPSEALNTSVSFQPGCVPGYDCVFFYGDAAPTLGDATASSTCVAQSGGMSCTLDPDHTGVHVVGGAGNDAVTFLESDIGGFPAATHYALVADGGDGNDTLIGGDAGETLGGGAGTDRLTGRGGDDTLDGGDGNDTLSGDADDQYSNSTAGGNDVLRGGAGDDDLVGDGSAQNAPIGHDVLDGGPGIDTAKSGWYRFDGSGGDEDPPPAITLDGVANDGRPGENDNLIGVEHVSTAYQPATPQPGTYVGSDGPDEINLVFADGNVSGGAGDDRITGSDSADTLDGGPGADQISGGFGNDVITGGPGQDDLAGDRTAACFYGPVYGTCTIGSGNDTINAQDGEKDVVDCGPGADTAYVDAVDVTTGCETLQVSGAPAGGGSGGGSGTGGGTGGGETGGGGTGTTPGLQPAKPSLAIGRLHLRTIARTRVLRLRCRLAQAGRCTVRASISASAARKLHLKVKKGAHRYTLGARMVNVKKAGTATVLIHVARRTAARLRHARSLRLTLTATARYTSGHATLTRRVSVRR